MTVMRRPLVKFCGMMSRIDVVHAADLGAAAVGFIMWPHSRRSVTPQVARELAAALPAFVVPVGVFVDQPLAEIQQGVEFAGLGAVQLHGRENPSIANALTCRVIKAIGEPGGDMLQEALQWSGDVTLLVDFLDPVRRGGTGHRADWTMARAIAEKRRVVLAGGLRADNVALAVAGVRPYAVDVSSGVEVNSEECPGVKDHRKMRDFMDALEAGVPYGPRPEEGR
jgi:phosphoribosylanthranilate isomerase